MDRVREIFVEFLLGKFIEPQVWSPHFGQKNKTNISQYRPNKVVRYKRFQLALRVTLIFFLQISDSK